MSQVSISRSVFLSDRQGRTFSDVAEEFREAFDEMLRFFSNADRQRRMEDSELHHDRAPLAGVVRELESIPSLQHVLRDAAASGSKRLRQAIGVVVRIIMEQRGWKKTGKKGSLGVRAPAMTDQPKHNTGGLALFFLRAERYERIGGMPYRTVRELCEELEVRRSKSRVTSTPLKAAGRRNTRSAKSNSAAASRLSRRGR